MVNLGPVRKGLEETGWTGDKDSDEGRVLTNNHRVSPGVVEGTCELQMHCTMVPTVVQCTRAVRSSEVHAERRCARAGAAGRFSLPQVPGASPPTAKGWGSLPAPALHRPRKLTRAGCRALSPSTQFQRSTLRFPVRMLRERHPANGRCAYQQEQPRAVAIASCVYVRWGVREAVET